MAIVDMGFEIVILLIILAIAGVQAGERRWKNAVIALLVAVNIFLLMGLLHANSMFQARFAGMEAQNEALRKTISQLQEKASNESLDLTADPPRD